jgi:probable HAF family extracellular repeat protein
MSVKRRQPIQLVALLAMSLAWQAMPALEVNAASFSFTSVGHLDGGPAYSQAYAVSGDGTVVVGRAATSNGVVAFRWTAIDGMSSLGDLPGGAIDSQALALSHDGSVIAGVSKSANGSEAFRWTATDGMVGLGDFPGGLFNSEARGVSADGKIVFGSGNSKSPGPGVQGFSWTTQNGLVALPNLPTQGYDNYIRSVSADGKAATGIASTVVPGVAFRWTQNAGLVGLGSFSGPTNFTFAEDISANGDVIVGWASGVDFGHHAFRWTAGEGLVRLVEPAVPSVGSEAWATSGDGSVIVGMTFTPDPMSGDVFYWTSSLGMRSLKQLLLDHGVSEVAGWQLIAARGISEDGRTIAGIGIYNNQELGWVATVPEPSTGALAALAFVVCGLSRVLRAKSLGPRHRVPLVNRPMSRQA